jgi:transcriptional regulator GlxA family with amidase domain
MTTPPNAPALPASPQVPDLSARRFGFLMFPGFEELDLIGPWEMATMWQAYAKGPNCVTVAARRDEIRCAKGLRVLPEHDVASVGALDYLLVPGGFSAFDGAKNADTLAFVRDRAAGAKAVLSVCSGSFILLAAGLLAGRRATTHWKAIAGLRAAGVQVQEERFVHDGVLWTSAGVSAGIDMMLAFIAAEAGEQAAYLTQLNAEYYPDGQHHGSPQTHPEAPAYIRRL